MRFGIHSLAFWVVMPKLATIWLALYVIASVKSYRKGNQS
jgi:hypothetical protein